MLAGQVRLRPGFDPAQADQFVTLIAFGQILIPDLCSGNIECTGTLGDVLAFHIALLVRQVD